MKTIYSIVTLIVFGFNSICFSQRILQDALIDYQKNNSKVYMESLLDGDYLKASKQIKQSKNKEIFNFNEFYANSIIYQRNYKKLKQAYLRNPEIFQPSLKFYLTQTPMDIILNKNVTINLSKNRIIGIIGSDTVNILFDTGGAGVSINKRFVERYKMQSDTSIKSSTYMPAFNYKSFESPVIIPTLMIGDMIMSNVPAKFINNKELNENAEIEKFDIIMGMDIFIGFVKSIKFDWISNNMTFSNVKSNQKLTNKFIFFDSKPITLTTIGNQTFTTLLDSGSPSDLIDKEIFQKFYTNKEEKKYGNYVYYEFTVPVKFGEESISLKAVDYKPNFNLILNDESIDFIIGNNHKSLTFDLENNLYEIN